MTKKVISLFTIVILITTVGLLTYLKTHEHTPDRIQATYNHVLENLRYTTEGRTEAIHQLERLLLIEKNISEQDQLTILKELTSLCIINTDYSKAIEHSLSAINLAQSLGEHYTLARMLIDLADMFITLGEYDMAQQIINKALLSPIEDITLHNRLTEYGYINLALVALELDDPQSAIDYVNKSIPYINKTHSNYEEKLLLRQLILAEASIAQNKPDESLAILSNIESAATLYGNRLIADLDINYLCTLGQTYILLGDLDLGLQSSHDALKLCDERDLPFLKLKILEHLVQILHQSPHAQYDTTLTHYEHQLLEQYHKVFQIKNKEDVSYILTTYEDKQNLIKSFQYKIKSIQISVVTGLFLLIIVGYTRMRFKKVKQANKIDGLTNAYNRKAFDLKYQKYLHKKIPISLIIFDVDYFKKINDTYGHSLGDIVLKNISKVVKSKLDSNASLFRYGGEEFCILCQNMQKEQVVALAELIRASVEGMHWKEELKVTISLGVAFSDEGDELLQLADKRLYHSKENGRNQVTSE